MANSGLIVTKLVGLLATLQLALHGLVTSVSPLSVAPEPPSAVAEPPANTPPDAPQITEPEFDGQLANGGDVHMEAPNFVDPDPGDVHLCTDWEIWSVVPWQRVWFTPCIGGVERVHTHLGDGVFENSHSGRTELFSDVDFVLRVRHRDDSGDPATEWSEFAERSFHTTPLTQVSPLEIEDVLALPKPSWVDETRSAIVLPGGASPASLRVESQTGELLLGIRGFDGVANLLIEPPPLQEHAFLRVVIDAGGSGQDLQLASSELAFVDDRGEPRTVYLPSATVRPGDPIAFWVSFNGSSYVADLSDSEPDFSLLAAGAPVPWQAPPGYKVEVVATGFQLPVNIAFVPNPGPLPGDPFYYVMQLYGTIKVVTRDGSILDYATGLLNFDPTGNFPGSGALGSTGIAVHSGTGDVFASMLYRSDPGNPLSSHYPKVVRFSSTDGGLTAATQSLVIDMFGELQGQSHLISNLSIGPDGHLYVHNGDGNDADTALDLESFRGKILRMRLDGEPVSGNPFYDANDGITARDYVYAYGMRNPFGGAWRAADGMHYEVENGPQTDRFAKVLPGVSYGWDGTNASMSIHAIYNWSPARAPINLTFVEPETFGGSGFPDEKMGHAFVSESGSTYVTGPNNSKRITEFVLDENGDLVRDRQDFVVYNGSGKATAAALAAGPDGLYFSDLYKDLDFSSPIDHGANILRVRFVGNLPACSDGSDNDLDGSIDHPDDPGCRDEFDRSEAWDCSDGIDNDGDGGIDFDPLTFEDPSQGTGDAGCRDEESPDEEPACSDGVDNDFDGLVDYDGAGLGAPDPRCSAPWDPFEVCGIGYELVFVLLPVMWLRGRRQRRRC